MNESVESFNKIVKAEDKIVDFETLNKLIKRIPQTMSGLLKKEDVLQAVAEASGIENPRTFVEEFERAEHGAEFWERSAENAWQRERETEHRAEVFERMAFKLQEERELLIWFLRKVCNGTWFCDCDGCANAEQFGACGDIDKSCAGCEKEGTCPCGTCERGSNLVFDPERAKKLWEEDERRKEDAGERL